MIPFPGSCKDRPELTLASPAPRSPWVRELGSPVPASGSHPSSCLAGRPRALGSQGGRGSGPDCGPAGGLLPVMQESPALSGGETALWQTTPVCGCPRTAVQPVAAQHVNRGVFWGFLLTSVGETLGRAERPAEQCCPEAWWRPLHFLCWVLSRLKYMSPLTS